MLQEVVQLPVYPLQEPEDEGDTQVYLHGILKSENVPIENTKMLNVF